MGVESVMLTEIDMTADDIPPSCYITSSRQIASHFHFWHTST